MISRLTTLAATFAILATATLAYATSTPREASHAPAAATPAQVIQLERVVITGKRPS